VKILIERVPEAFQDQYKRFFSRFNDPVYAKLAKTEILQLIASEYQHKEIVAELAETAKDLSLEVAKRSILAIGRIAIRLEAAIDNALHELIQLLDVPSSHVCDWAMVALRDVMRRHRDVAPTVIPELQKCMKTISSSEGKTALVWILGEYGEEIQESPYILEELISGWDEENSPVKLQLLTTSVKLFFKRTSEMKENLMSALNKGCADAAHPDVHDRALFYLRLIAHGLQHARRVFTDAQIPISIFEDQARPEVKDKIFEEFNTLSVVFDEPSERFVKKISDIVESAAVSTSPSPQTPIPSAVDATPKPTATGAVVSQGNLVDFSASASETSPSQTPAAANPRGSSVILKPNPQLSPKAFESTWKQLPAG
jgi:vesicle coat complex subunit